MFMFVDDSLQKFVFEISIKFTLLRITTHLSHIPIN